MKKRLFILCMIALVAFSFIGCDDKKPEPATPEEKVLVGEIYTAVFNSLGKGTRQDDGSLLFKDVTVGEKKLNGTLKMDDTSFSMNVNYDGHTAVTSFSATEGAAPKEIIITLDGKDIIVDSAIFPTGSTT